MPGQVLNPVERKRMQAERKTEEKELRNGERKSEETTTGGGGAGGGGAGGGTAGEGGGGGGLRKETYTVSSPSLYLRERASTKRTGSPPAALLNGSHIMRELERPQVAC